jgi:hypothetical protein
MTEPKISVHKVTKPLQLLATWLVGLIAVIGSFLSAAAFLTSPSWAPGFLIVIAALCVPLFLVCVFLLQTRFRPEMQEDTFYSKYLEMNQAITGKDFSGINPDESMSHLKDLFIEGTQTIINLLHELGVNLQSITDQLASISDKDLSITDTHKKIADLEAKMADSSKKIINAKRIIVWKSNEIIVNDLLPNYEEITNKLVDNGIKISRTFGSTSESLEEPKEHIITFGNKVDIDLLRCLVNLLRPFGFDKIHYTSWSYHSKKIFIGSYIYNQPEEGRICNLDGPVIEKLENPNVDIKDFIDLIFTESKLQMSDAKTKNK